MIRMSKSMYTIYEDSADLHVKTVNIYANTFGTPVKLCRTWLNSEESTIGSMASEYTGQLSGQEDAEYIAGLIEKGLLRLLVPYTTSAKHIEYHAICAPVKCKVKRYTAGDGSPRVTVGISVIDPTSADTLKLINIDLQ